MQTPHLKLLIGTTALLILLLVAYAVMVTRAPEDVAPTPETVSLYYYNPDLDTDETGNVMCTKEGLVAVPRTMAGVTVESAILLLLQGALTEEERAAGITTEFPLEGLTLQAASLDNGTLTLTFLDPNSRTVGGACRTGVLWAQIEATALQFDGVNEVRFAPEELFQP